MFDGIGAMIVSSALDPAAIVDGINTHNAGALSWIAPKLTGTDTGGDTEIKHCINVWRGLGLSVGGWIYNMSPATDVALVTPWKPLLDFVVWDVEAPYKADETAGGYAKAAQLVALTPADWTCAVTSYGGYKSSIDFATFAKAGWPIFAQGYDAFTCTDRLTYLAVYPDDGIHCLTRTMALEPGEAVYRPESIDG